jgi:hypothetical protein
MRNIIPTFRVRLIIVRIIPTGKSTVTSPMVVIAIIAASSAALPWMDLKYLLAASSAANVAPDATRALKAIKAAASPTSSIDRVFIIHGGLMAASN